MIAQSATRQKSVEPRRCGEEYLLKGKLLLGRNTGEIVNPVKYVGAHLKRRELPNIWPRIVEIGRLHT